MEESHGDCEDLSSPADKLSPWLREALHSLSTRIPKICLQRVDQVYPSLNASQISSGNSPLTISIRQHELTSVSATDEGTSQSTDVDLCPYSCDVCNKKFNNIFQLQKHTVIHKNQQSAKSGTESERQNVQIQKSNRSKQNSFRHICSICDKSFERSGHLTTHMRTHTGERPFSCDICNKSFVVSGKLHIHMRTHTGERPYSCDICNKSFAERGALKTHMGTHTGERPFSCDICDKSFIVFGNLKTHMRTHTGERPFSCDICDKSFTISGDLKRHMRTHTGERPFSCNICNKSFTARGSLQRHMKTNMGSCL